MNLVIEAPNSLHGQIAVAGLARGKLLLGELVNPGRREGEHAQIQLRGLVTSSADLSAIRSGTGVRADGRRGAQR